MLNSGIIWEPPQLGRDQTASDGGDRKLKVGAEVRDPRGDSAPCS